jgi:hypothetical protein
VPTEKRVMKHIQPIEIGNGPKASTDRRAGEPTGETMLVSKRIGANEQMVFRDPGHMAARGQALARPPR